MQLIPLTTALLALATSMGSARVANENHPAADLFIRRHDSRSGPVELWTGGDPQLELLKRDPFYATRDAPVARDPHTKRRCGDLHDMMPMAMKRDGLQRRQQTTVSPGTGTPYPAPGATSPSADTLPKAWVDKYNQVKAAGLIPNIPVATPNAA